MRVSRLRTVETRTFRGARTDANRLSRGGRSAGRRVPDARRVWCFASPPPISISPHARFRLARSPLLDRPSPSPPSLRDSASSMRSKMTLYLSLMSPRVLLTSSSSRNRSASAPSSPAHPWSNAESLSPASSSPAPPSESRGVGESSARGEPRSSASISYAESATTGSRGVGGVGPRDAPRDAPAPGAAVVAESPARRSMSRRLRAEGGGGREGEGFAASAKAKEARVRRWCGSSGRGARRRGAEASRRAFDRASS